MRGSFRALIVACAASLALAGCGGGGGSSTGTATTPAVTAPSSSDLQAVEIAFLQSMTASTNSGSSALSAARSIKSISVSGGCSIPTGGLTTSQCNIQWSGTDTTGCSSGNISVSGSITGTLNLAGGVSNLSLSDTETPESCTVGNWTISGSPYISLIGTFTVTGSTASLSGTGPQGGWTMTHNGVTITCSIVSPPSWNESGAHGSLSGGTLTCNGISYTTPSYAW